MNEVEGSSTPEGPKQEETNKVSNKVRKRKKLIFFVLLFDLIVILPIILYFILIPKKELSSLEKGYVSIKLNSKDKAVYSLSDKRPAGWVSLKEVSHVAAHAIVVSEDWAFYQHSGYDLGQIKEAAMDAVSGQRTRGASTISQQVIKNVFLTPEKTLGRKGKELFYSITMERNVSKQKILETYLNIAEFGKGVYGIKAAAKHYFKKSPKELNAKEGAFLAMLLPSPRKYAQSFKQQKMTPFAKKTVNSILEKMVRAKYLRENQLSEMKNKNFSWETQRGTSGISKLEFENTVKIIKEEQVVVRPVGVKKVEAIQKIKKAKKAVKAKLNPDGYRGDEDLELEENPEFDEDAIGEDISGVQEEFSVE